MELLGEFGVWRSRPCRTHLPHAPRPLLHIYDSLRMPPCALKPRGGWVCRGHAYVRTRAMPMRTGHAAISSCRVYASSRGTSSGDFVVLAAGQKARREFRSFEDARAYVHTLGLKGQKEWDAWSASGARPYDIPSTPQTYYASSGWTSYGDFLGYDIGKKARS